MTTETESEVSNEQLLEYIRLLQIRVTALELNWTPEEAMDLYFDEPRGINRLLTKDEQRTLLGILKRWKNQMLSIFRR